MENVNGRKLVESGNLCERKNGRGVDPNRNWDAHWGFKEADYDPAEEYPGAAAFRYLTIAYRTDDIDNRNGQESKDPAEEYPGATAFR